MQAGADAHAERERARARESESERARERESERERESARKPEERSLFDINVVLIANMLAGRDLFVNALSFIYF